MKVEKIRIGDYKIPIFDLLTAENGEKVRKSGSHQEGKFGIRYSKEFEDAVTKPHIFMSDVIFAVSNDEFEIKRMMYEIASRSGWL